MAVGADNVEPAQPDHLFMLFLPVFIISVPWVSPQYDVNAAPGHVGGHGYRSRLAGLGDDIGFLFVLLGVEYMVGDVLPGEQVA